MYIYKAKKYVCLLSHHRPYFFATDAIIIYDKNLSLLEFFFYFEKQFKFSEEIFFQIDYMVDAGFYLFKSVKYK